MSRPAPTTEFVGRRAAAFAVIAIIVYNAVTLRAELTSVAYLNDSAIHAEMVRYAVQRLVAGHLPLTGWFPFLGEGSPLFLHYQSLGATLTGIAGLATGSDAAFRIVLYVLLVTWPASVYAGVRLLGFDRLAAVASALVAPFVVSSLGIGYEQQSYFAIGYGLFSQLFAMWTLPLAWGWSWRQMREGRGATAAAFAVAATCAFHFLTGYLAIAGVVIAALTCGAPTRTRLRRLGALTWRTVLLGAWVVVPLVALRPWTSINEFLQHGPDVRSYGARQIVRWFATGQLFDAHRLPVITVLVAAGVVVLAASVLRAHAARNVLGLLAISLVLFFGPTTFGGLFDVIPGHADLFFRRFLMGVQLAGIVAAGTAVTAAARGAERLMRRRGELRPVVAAGAAAVAALLLVPLIARGLAIDASESAFVGAQAAADASAGRTIAPIIDMVQRRGGRVYAGLPVPSNQVGGWGSSLTVGEVPVFKYLTRFGVDEVGYTLRTASLMTDPEVYFDEDVPRDYSIFGVRWCIFPVGKRPAAPATIAMVRGPYVLWRLTGAGAGAVALVDTVGTIRADRTNIGAATSSFVRSPPPGPTYPTVGFGGAPAAPPTAARAGSAAPGTVTSVRTDLGDGRASATVTARRRAVVLLKSSYDPGWTATVDGHRVPTQMIAPAYVGVVVPPGTHRVVFRFRPFAPEPYLLALAGLTAASLLVVARRKRAW